jgi:hypothetical protein
MSPWMDLSSIQTLEVPKILKNPIKPCTKTLRGYMQNMHTFGPKCKNHGNRVPHVTWFTCLRIYKLKGVNWAYLQKGHFCDHIVV